MKPTLPAFLLLVFAIPLDASAAENVTLPWRHLTVHGPLSLSPSDLANLQAPSGNAGSPETIPPLDPPVFDGVGVQSPLPSTRWFADGRLDQIDPGIAVGKSYVLVGSYVTAALYDKSGNMPGPKYQGIPYPNPFRLTSLFDSIKGDINLHVALPAGLPPGVDVANGYGVDDFFDGRVMYDEYRGRFWIVALTRSNKLRAYVESCPQPPPAATCGAEAVRDFPALKTARRSHIVAAVSKTEDPRDGFFLYWWDASINDGTCDVLAGCDDVLKFGFQGGDYPTAGISSKFLLATDGLSYKDAGIDTSTKSKAQKWIDCENAADCGNDHGYAHLVAVGADQLAKTVRRAELSPVYTIAENNRNLKRCNGLCTFKSGWQFAAYHTAENKFTDVSSQARGMRPAVHHGVVPFGRSYFVNNYVAPDGKAYLVTWGLKSGSPQFVRGMAEVASFSIQTWSVVVNASVRKGDLYAAWNDLGALTFARVVHTAFSFDDPLLVSDEKIGLSKTLIHYSWPAVETNQDGNVAVVYFRHDVGAGKLGQEVRYSVKEPNQLFRPSRLLKDAENRDGPAQPDTVGIAVDPFDDMAIWMAHFYADSELGLRIAVGKVFGSVYPDFRVYIDSSELAAERSGGESVRLEARVVNHGDGRSAGGRTVFYLSRDTTIRRSDRPITDVPVHPLEPGEEMHIAITAPVDPRTPRGEYFVLARVEQTDPESPQEYSLDNESPMLGIERKITIR